MEKEKWSEGHRLKAFYSEIIDVICGDYTDQPNAVRRELKMMVISLRAVGEYAFAETLKKYAIAKIKRNLKAEIA